MCGICGFIGAPDNVDRQKMLSSLAHRGPDDRGEFEAAALHGVVWLGNTRLAILDLSPAGHQPMHTPSVKEISQRHKMGFVLPIENWLRNGLQVGNPLTLSTGLEKKEISKVIKGFQAGQDFRAYWTISGLAKWVENMGMLPPLG